MPDIMRSWFMTGKTPSIQGEESDSNSEDRKCYKASGWTYVGETKGFSCKRGGREGKWMKKQWSHSGVKKHIYVKPLHRYYNKKGRLKDESK